MSVEGWIAVAVAVLFASCLQGSIGFGMGMVAAPMMALVEPGLIPAVPIMLATVVTVCVVVRERQSVDLSGTGWALLGRVPGSLAGAALVAVLPAEDLGTVLAVSVVLGVVLTIRGWRPPPRRRNLLMAGAASGVLGTATSIGGAPMALVWQGSRGPVLRGTMSSFFLVGSVVSVAMLAAAGQVSRVSVVAAGALLPVAVGGVALSWALNRWLDPVRARWVAIGASLFGALSLIAIRVF